VGGAALGSGNGRRKELAFGGRDEKDRNNIE